MRGYLWPYPTCYYELANSSEKQGGKKMAKEKDRNERTATFINHFILQIIESPIF